MGARVADYDANEEEFAKKYATAVQLRAEGAKSIEELKVQLEERATAIESRYGLAAEALQTLRHRYETDQAKLVALQDAIAATPDGEEERLRAEAEALEDENRKKEQELMPLRAKRDDLLKRKKELEAKLASKK